LVQHSRLRRMSAVNFVKRSPLAIVFPGGGD
jgi:hypothetical protein